MIKKSNKLFLPFVWGFESCLSSFSSETISSWSFSELSFVEMSFSELSFVELLVDEVSVLTRGRCRLTTRACRTLLRVVVDWDVADWDVAKEGTKTRTRRTTEKHNNKFNPFGLPEWVFVLKDIFVSSLVNQIKKIN